MAILTKAELLASFPDNTGGDISAENVRDFVQSNLSLEFLTISSTPITVSNTTDIIIGTNGAGIVNLPVISTFKDRPLVITNDSTVSTMTINPNGSETINLLSSLSMEPARVVIIYSEIGSTDWNIIIDNLSQFTRLEDTPSSYSGEAGQILAINSGETGVEFVNPATQTAQFFEDDAGTTTTINDLVNFEDLNISLAANSGNTLTDFSVSGNTVTKTTTGTQLYSVLWNSDGAPDSGNNRMYTFKAHLNGSTALDGQFTLTATSARENGGGLQTLISMAQNDTLDFKIKADTDVENFISDNNSILIRRA